MTDPEKPGVIYVPELGSEFQLTHMSEWSHRMYVGESYRPGPNVEVALTAVKLEPGAEWRAPDGQPREEIGVFRLTLDDRILLEASALAMMDAAAVGWRLRPADVPPFEVILNASCWGVPPLRVNSKPDQKGLRDRLASALLGYVELTAVGQLDEHQLLRATLEHPTTGRVADVAVQLRGIRKEPVGS